MEFVVAVGGRTANPGMVIPVCHIKGELVARGTAREESRRDPVTDPVICTDRDNEFGGTRGCRTGEDDTVVVGVDMVPR